MSELKFLIPVLWVLTGCIIGLIMYKSSEVFFGSTKKDNAETRRVRVAGSTAIAALVFYGLKWSTPEVLLQPLPENLILIEKRKVEDVVNSINRLEVSLDQMSACQELAKVEECSAQMSSLKSDVSLVRRRVEELGSH